MRRSIRCGWLVVGMTIAPQFACDKPPNSAPEVRKKDSPAEMPNGPAFVEEPTAEKPVVATASLRPAKARRGDTIDLIVEVRILSGWHLYAADAPVGSAIPTSIVQKLPAGIEAAGAWQYPKTVSSLEAPGGIYEGRLTFRLPLKIAERAQAGRIDVTCELTYQACDPFHCLPPQTLSLPASGEVEPTH